MQENLLSYTADIRMKLGGDVGEAELPLHVILSRLYSTINRRIVELNISTQNWMLKYYDFAPTGQASYPMSGAEDFGTPVLIEVGNRSGGSFVPLELVNFSNLRLALEADKVAVAFGTSNDVPYIYFTHTVRGGVVRVWYEPDAPMPRNLEANIPLRRLFRDYITSETALLCLPYVRFGGKDTATASTFKMELASSLRAEIDGPGGWREAWETEINRAKTQGRVTRIPFRAGMR